VPGKRWIEKSVLPIVTGIVQFSQMKLSLKLRCPAEFLDVDALLLFADSLVILRNKAFWNGLDHQRLRRLFPDRQQTAQLPVPRRN
jgi:hypothetical protein